MPTFKDAEGRQWRVEFDGLILDDVLTETGIDLADLSGGGLAKIDEHAPSLVRALCVLCRDELVEKNLTAKDFAKAIRGEAISSAIAAVLGSAEAFFPKSTWSEVQLRLTKHRAAAKEIAELTPDIRLFSQLPPEIVGAFAEMMGGGDLTDLVRNRFAGGQADIPPTSASNSPENAESAPAA